MKSKTEFFTFSFLLHSSLWRAERCKSTRKMTSLYLKKKLEKQNCCGDNIMCYGNDLNYGDESYCSCINRICHHNDSSDPITNKKFYRGNKVIFFRAPCWPNWGQPNLMVTKSDATYSSVAFECSDILFLELRVGNTTEMSGSCAISATFQYTSNTNKYFK